MILINQAAEMMITVVVIQGSGIRHRAHKKHDRYKDAVERMSYFADLGVKFKFCGLAAAGLFVDNTHMPEKKYTLKEIR